MEGVSEEEFSQSPTAPVSEHTALPPHPPPQGLTWA